MTAGCDKSFATCRARFANTDNFRGFPQIPGNDFLIGSPTQGAPGNDGLSLAPPHLPGRRRAPEQRSTKRCALPGPILRSRTVPVCSSERVHRARTREIT